MQKDRHNPQKKSKKKWMILTAAVLAVAVLVTVGYFAGECIRDRSTVEEESVVVENENGYDTRTPFSIAVPSEENYRPEGAYRTSLERLEGLSDAPIKWIRLADGNAVGDLKKRVSSGKYPDVVIGNFLSAEEISQYRDEGLLVPLEDYINETDTPNIWKLYQERPAIKAASVAPDGHIYTLPRVKEFAPDYLQNVIWINKTWLDNLNLAVPKTLTELKTVLKAFKEEDPNGNGIMDEIPMTFQPRDSYAYPEALLSCWGMSTKRGTEDGWLTVQNGEVKFAPTTEEWKSMVAYYRDLYAEGLIDPEAFKHDNDAFAEKLLSPTSIVGLTWSSTNPMANADEYIAIPPFRASSKVRPAWRIHPSSTGIKDAFFIFQSCENPGAAIRWADKLYDFDNSVQNIFGEYGFSISKREDGTICWNPSPEEEETENTYFERCVLLSGMPGAILKEDYGIILDLTPEQQEKLDIYQQYERFLDDEVWNRPYYTAEEEKELSNLRDDISDLVSVKLMAWVVGAEDPEDSWDQYLCDLEEMGLSEMLAIYQTAYDRYQAGMTK